MSIKKLLVNACLVSLLGATLCASAINASAASNTFTLRDDVKTFEYRYSQTYSTSAIYPGWTGITYKTAGYEDNWKYAYYAIYGGNESTGFYMIGSPKVAQGTSEQVVTYYDGSAVSGLVAKREHKTHIRYTSSSTSSKKDELTYNVIKYWQQGVFDLWVF